MFYLWVQRMQGKVDFGGQTMTNEEKAYKQKSPQRRQPLRDEKILITKGV